MESTSGARRGPRRAATYGPAWLEFRDWYRTRPWLPWRCVWCWRGPRPANPIQLNHLTDAMPDPDRPAWWQVAPMCKRCHGWETRLTRWLYGAWPYRRDRYAHYRVTLGVPAVAVLLVLLAVAVPLAVA